MTNIQLSETKWIIKEYSRVISKQTKAIEILWKEIIDEYSTKYNSYIKWIIEECAIIILKKAVEILQKSFEKKQCYWNTSKAILR